MLLTGAKQKLLLVALLFFSNFIFADALSEILRVLNDPDLHYIKVTKAIEEGQKRYPNHPEFLKALANLYWNGPYWGSQQKIAKNIDAKTKKDHRISEAGGDGAWAEAADIKNANQAAEKLLKQQQSALLRVLSESNLSDSRVLHALTNLNSDPIFFRELSKRHTNLFKILLLNLQKKPKNSLLLNYLNSQVSNLGLPLDQHEDLNLKILDIALKGDIESNRKLISEFFYKLEARKKVLGLNDQTVSRLYPELNEISKDYVPGKLTHAYRSLLRNAPKDSPEHAVGQFLIEYANSKVKDKKQMMSHELETALNTLSTVHKITFETDLEDFHALTTLNTIKPSDEASILRASTVIGEKFSNALVTRDGSNFYFNGTYLNEILTAAKRADAAGLFNEKMEIIAANVLAFGHLLDTNPMAETEIYKLFIKNPAKTPEAQNFLIRRASKNGLALLAVEKALPFIHDRETQDKLEVLVQYQLKDNGKVTKSPLYKKLQLATTSWYAKPYVKTCHGFEYAIACGKNAAGKVSDFCKNFIPRKKASAE